MVLKNFLGHEKVKFYQLLNNEFKLIKDDLKIQLVLLEIVSMNLSYNNKFIAIMENLCS